jgi:hypothetical protein
MSELQDSINRAQAASLKNSSAPAAVPGAHDFDSIVRPLERAIGKALDGPGRDLCERSFVLDPEGFQLMAAKALHDGKNPPALLVHMCKRREKSRWSVDDIDEPPQPVTAR